MRIKPVIDFLKANCPSLTDVRPAVSLSPVELEENEIPLVFVHSGPEESTVLGEKERNRQQRMERNVVLLIVAKGYDPDTGTDQLEDIRKEIRDHLLGEQFEEKSTSMQATTGEVFAIQGPLTWWRDVYREFHFVRGAL